jgi:hypothetical protein
MPSLTLFLSQMTRVSVKLMRAGLWLSWAHIVSAFVSYLHPMAGWSISTLAVANVLFWLLVLIQRDCIVDIGLIETLGRQQTLAIWLIGSMFLLSLQERDLPSCF